MVRLLWTVFSTDSQMSLCECHELDHKRDGTYYDVITNTVRIKEYGVRCYYVPGHNVPCCIKCPCIITSRIHYVPCLLHPQVYDSFGQKVPNSMSLSGTSLDCLQFCTLCPYITTSP